MYPRSPRKLSRRELLAFIAIVSFTIIIHSAFVLRYDGRWVEWDTAATTRTVASTYEEETAFSTIPYNAGFGYQVLSTTLGGIVGISPQDLQQKLMPVTAGIVPALILVALFRSLMGSTKAWIAASIIVCIQPEFILTTSRGTHEKLTFSLIMIFLLVTVLSCSSRRRSNTPFILVSLIVLPSLVFSNSFFAFSFFTALIVGLVLFARRYLLGTRQNSRSGRLQPSPGNIGILPRLSPLIGLCLVFMFIFELYPPAVQLINTFSSFVDKVTLLFSGHGELENPYAAVWQSWTSPGAWVLTNLLTFFIIASSVLGFVLYLFTKNHTDSTRLIVPIYLGVVVVVMAAILLDFIGASDIRNLQIRLIPLFLFVALPVSFIVLGSTFEMLSRIIRRRFLMAILILLLIPVLVLSFMRATSDPMISNDWKFYSVSEEEAVQWVSDNGVGRCWGDFDYRIGSIFVFEHGYPRDDGLRFASDGAIADYDYAIVSDVTIEREERLDMGNSVPADWNILCDLGESKVYSRQ